jgi:hypothetical protein
MVAAFGENNRHVDPIRPHHLVHVGEPGYREFLSDTPGLPLNDVTNCNEACVIDLPHCRAMPHVDARCGRSPQARHQFASFRVGHLWPVFRAQAGSFPFFSQLDSANKVIDEPYAPLRLRAGSAHPWRRIQLRPHRQAAVQVARRARSSTRSVWRAYQPSARRA